MKLAVGASERTNERAAAAEAVAGAARGGDVPAFALVLATDSYDARAMAEAVTHAFGSIAWAGCISTGVFAGARFLRQGLVVGALSAPGARVGVGVGQPVSRDPRGAGARAAEGALAGFAATAPAGWSRALLVFSDAVAGNGGDVVRGALQVAGTAVVWAGGGAGDVGSVRPPGHTTFGQGQAHADSVVIVAIEAPVRLAAGISHGFRPYGPPTMVTRAHGAVAAELEYQEAFAVYQRTARDRGDDVHLTNFSAFAITHPLGIPRADGEHVIRDPLRVDDSGGLQCFADVPDGSLIRVMEGDRAGLLRAAGAAARAARDAVAGPLGGALVFDCVSRPALLGAGFADELAIFSAMIGDGVPLMGCLTFGEVGALGHGAPQFHNKTAVVLALGR
jgi:hypothetical protein